MKCNLSSLFVKGLISSFVIALNINATFAETYLIRYPGSPLSWGDVGIWRTGSPSSATQAVYIPGYYDELLGIDTRDAKIIFPGGSNDSNLVLNVDDNYTVAMFEHEHGQYGVTMNMAGQLNEGANDSSITIKASNPAATTYDFIAVGSAVTYQEGVHELSYTAFNGGTVKLTGLNEGGTAQIKVYCNKASDTQLCPSHLTFSETTTFISESNLNIIGDKNASIPPMNLNSTVNLNGTTIIGVNGGTEESPQWTYKSLNVGNSSNSVQGTSLTVNVGGTLTANSLVQYSKSLINLSGTMELVASMPDSWNTGSSDNFSPLRVMGNFVMQDGGVLNVTGTANSISNGGVYVASSGSFVMESGSKLNLVNSALRSTSSGSSTAAYIDIQEGAEVSAKSFWIGANTQMSIAGKVTITDGTMYAYGSSTLVTIKSGVDLNVKYITLAYSSLRIDEGVAAGSIKADSVRIDNNGGRVQLYSSNAIVNRSSLKSDDVYFMGLIGKCYLDIYADQTFDSLRFYSQDKRNGINSIDYYVYIDNAVNLVSLNTLANNTLIKPDDADLLERYLILDNFRNELIHVENIDSSIDLSLISSKNGDWTDFRFEVDPNGGYWLAATYIPEPSVYAAVLGLTSMALVLRFRRK